MFRLVRVSVPVPAAVNTRLPPLSRMLPERVVPPVSLAVTCPLASSVVVPVKATALVPPTVAVPVSSKGLLMEMGAVAIMVPPLGFNGPLPRPCVLDTSKVPADTVRPPVKVLAPVN